MKKNRKAFIFILIILLGLILNKKYNWSSYLLNPNNLVEIKEFVKLNYILSAILYIVLTILGSSILALPGVTFAIISTGLFGPWMGSLYCLLGTSLGATLSFILSRYLLKDSVMELVKKNDKLYRIIFQNDSQKEMLILMITRLLPIFPFNLQNFAYGITNISIIKYFIGTFVFMIPGIILFSIGTEGFINTDDRWKMFLIMTIIVVFMVLIGLYLYRKYKLITVKEQDER